MKTRLDVYLDLDLFKQLDATAHQTRASRSSVAEVAIASFLSADGADKREAAVVRRLDRLSRQYAKLERNLTITTETLALFVRYQLAIAPPVPVEDEAAVKAKGRERFELFITRLGQRLAEGKSLTHDVIDEVRPKATDFFSLDLEAAGND